MRYVAAILVILLISVGTVGAQDVEEKIVWYWGIDLDAATLVAYNVQGNLNKLDVPLDPSNPQALVWRVDDETALALVEIDHQLLLYELSTDSATRMVTLKS
ncbi:MAG: hypothetical protein K8L99_23160 [Anaerolineae bacterium]|nr:hypothetical protein [Anaerolineae bacterium]